MVKNQYPHKHICSRCRQSIARNQTVRGKENEKNGGLEINNGWFCNKCWNEGVSMENEAMKDISE